MPAANFIAAIGVALTMSACASIRGDYDDMCAEIARFVSASSDTTVHSVHLLTDWGGVFFKSENPDEEVFAAKGCDHDGYEPGKKLCDYLLNNTSTEFAAINYRRALRCVGVTVTGLSPTDDDRLPPWASTERMRGVPAGTSIKVVFTRGTNVTLPTLAISAQAGER